MPTTDRGLRGLATATVVIAPLGVQLSRGTWPLQGVNGDPCVSWSDVAIAVAYATASLLILHEQPRHAVGWILGIAGLLLPLSATAGV